RPPRRARRERRARGQRAPRRAKARRARARRGARAQRAGGGARFISIRTHCGSMPPTMDALLTADGLVALATLAALEIVLGVDNIVFIAILTSRLPARQQAVARRIGLILALGIRIGLLFTISWLMGLTRPLFAVLGHPLTGRDLILIVGGLFLVGKATWELYVKLEVEHVERARGSHGRFTDDPVQSCIVIIVLCCGSGDIAVSIA